MNILISTIFVTGLLAMISQRALACSTISSMVQPERKLAMQCATLITTAMFAMSIVGEVAQHM